MILTPEALKRGLFVETRYGARTEPWRDGRGQEEEAMRINHPEMLDCSL